MPDHRSSLRLQGSGSGARSGGLVQIRERSISQLRGANDLTKAGKRLQQISKLAVVHHRGELPRRCNRFRSSDTRGPAPRKHAGPLVVRRGRVEEHLRSPERERRISPVVMAICSLPRRGSQ